jgi:hypothetical protein
MVSNSFLLNVIFEKEFLLNYSIHCVLQFACACQCRRKFLLWGSVLNVRNRRFQIENILP